MKKTLGKIRIKLFFSLCGIIIIIILFLILVNNFVFEKFFIYEKTQALKTAFSTINAYYMEPSEVNIENELEKIAIQNNFDILIKGEDNTNIYTSNKNFYEIVGQMNDITNKTNSNDTQTLETNDRYNIQKMKNSKNGVSYILLIAKTDNNYNVYIRMPITTIEESVKISNNFLYLIAGFTILISAVLVSVVSKKFAQPISELNTIAKKMSNLDFSQKYNGKEGSDEINDLGNSINIMSKKLEATIKQLRQTNIELEKDIEEKSKIEEMRKSFISDVSHELKTPIALIQGYSEGLLENVNKDEESRRFYAEVILDESNKMDKLVKQLLELMKLEYGKREFNNSNFNIVELEKEIIRKSTVMLEEQKIEVRWETANEIQVFADDFYVEQIITNYLTNAIKNIVEINKEKFIKITNEVDIDRNKVIIKVFNTGNNISEEDLNRIWNRFYKVDESRNRAAGGSGIGLSLVKAIMNNYENAYGVVNKENGVEFYFELNMNI